jgi:hypothetical protein
MMSVSEEKRSAVKSFIDVFLMLAAVIMYVTGTVYGVILKHFDQGSFYLLCGIFLLIQCEK